MPDIPPLVPSKRKYNARKPTDRHHYGELHRELRAARLKKYPTCEYRFPNICTILSEEADHLVYPARHIDHYKATCKACHKEKHRKKS